MKTTQPLTWAAAAATLLCTAGCNPAGSVNSNRAGGASAGADAAERTWVAPGKLDEYYVFYSGGHSGQVFVSAIPSMRHITTIPVFAPYPGTGYGFDEDSRKMLGEYTWGDVHHPNLSKTNGDYDGRWLFVNDNANNRIARIDLRDFRTHEILGPIPNSMGNHGSSFVTANTEYILCATRFSVPLPKGRYADPNDYATQFNGMVSGITVDPQSGHMTVGWQILTPPFDWDLGATGRGPSDGWAFWTSYNSEMAHTDLEANASQLDRDYGAVVNWRAAIAAVKEGKATLMDGVPVLDPAKVPGILYFLPIPKSPHGIDPDPSGRWICASGKLQPVTSVFDFLKIKEAIAKKDFSGEVRGIPVIRYEDVLEGEVPVGLGPLHTQFDERGNAYTSLYIESAIAKWKLPPWTPEQKADLNKTVVDKIPVHYNIGHLVVAGGDAVHPYGKWMIAMNKMSKGRHLSVGPDQPEDSELIDISGSKMKEVYETFTEPEPHFAQILKADAIKPIEVYPKEENHDPDAVWDPNDAGVTRHGNVVVAKILAIRSHYVPDRIDAQVGDTVIVHITNNEQSSNMIHGFGVVEQNVNLIIAPGETKTATIVMRKPGVFPFYCTKFCSALHQEMQGYLAVKPAPGAATAK